MNFRQPLDEADQSPFILDEGAVNYSYPIHLFLVDPFEADSPGVQIVYISEIEGKTLVAIPFSAWNRAVSKRALPQSALAKAALVEVLGCRMQSREDPDPDVRLKVWVGFLKKSLEKNVHLGLEEFKCDHVFDGDEENPMLPFSQSLIDAAQEHFAFFSAEEPAEIPDEDVELMQDGDGGLPDHLSERVGTLEQSMAEVQQGIQELLMLHRGEGQRQPSQHRPSALRKPVNQQSVPVMVPTAKMKSQGKFPLLDAGVVTAALQAGVPESNLLEMQRLLGNPKGKASKIRDMNPSVVPDPISEDEDEGLRAAQEAEGSGSVPPLDPMQQALEKLTSIVHTLTLDKQKKSAASRIDQALDGVTGSSLDSTSGLGSGKKNAAARRTLRSIFNDHPEEVSQVVERLMYEDLNSQTLGPGQVPKGLNARAWVEFRSRIGNYKTSAHSSWSAAGVLDSLIAGDVPKARARCALLLLQLDQASIDRGNWGLASELALEPPPPFSSLATHVAPSVADGEMPFSRLLDARWAEISLGFLKDQDDYMVRRKNVGKFNVVKKETDASDEPDPKKRPKPKPKAKGGGQSSQPEN